MSYLDPPEIADTGIAGVGNKPILIIDSKIDIQTIIKLSESFTVITTGDGMVTRDVFFFDTYDYQANWCKPMAIPISYEPPPNKLITKKNKVINNLKCNLAFQNRPKNINRNKK